MLAATDGADGSRAGTTSSVAVAVRSSPPPSSSFLLLPAMIRSSSTMMASACAAFLSKPPPAAPPAAAAAASRGRHPPRGSSFRATAASSLSSASERRRAPTTAASSSSSSAAAAALARSFSSGSSAADSSGGSERCRSAVSLLPSYLADARAVTKYCPNDAPDGALQLGVAENQMLEDLLVPAVRRFSSGADGVVGGGGDFEADQIYYQPTHGRPSLRTALASFLARLLKLPPGSELDDDGIVAGAGCNAVLENLCFSLAERGDAVLIPTPYYAAFEFDLVARAGLNIVPVTTFDHHPDVVVPNADSDDPIPPEAYHPNVPSLDAAYDRATSNGAVPKILLLSHPNNPLGICYPPEVTKNCIDWCRDRGVHLVSDEIYAGSVYRNGGGSGFVSALELAASSPSDAWEPNEKGLGLGPYVHFVYALSKDFALSGLRVGVAYSENESIRVPMQKLNDLCSVSSQTQALVERMVASSADDDGVVVGGDDERETVGEEKKGEEEDGEAEFWTDRFLEENRRRIRERCDALQSTLDGLRVPYLSADSGLFVWMDLREFLPPSSGNEEGGTAGGGGAENSDDGDARERELYLDLVRGHGLLFTPGSSMRAERAGFFRCVFAAASEQEFSLALDRIRTFVSQRRGAAGR